MQDGIDKVNFVPYFINHNLFFETDLIKDFDDLYSGINTNSGNGLIASSLAKLLGIHHFTDGIQNFFTCDPAQLDLKKINHNFTHALLILEDHLGEQWNQLPWARMQSILEAIDLPLIVFSLGACGVQKTPQDIANGMSPQARDFFKVLSSRAVSIGVRGATTAQVLELLDINNYQVVGCPTFFESGPERVVASPQIDAHSKVVGTGLFTSNVFDNVHYVLQSEVELLKALSDQSSFTQADAAAFVGHPWPDFPEQLLRALDCDRVRFFTNPEDWRDFFDDSVALTVGTRVHGGIVSLNQSRPVIITAGDVRAIEMCDFFKIPHFPGAFLADTSPDELARMADPTQLNAAYPQLYESFQAWLKACRLPALDKPLAELDWKIRSVRLLSGTLAAERIRGGRAALQVEELQSSIQQFQDREKELLLTGQQSKEREDELIAAAEELKQRSASENEAAQAQAKELYHQLGTLKLKYKDLLARHFKLESALSATEFALQEAEAAVNEKLALITAQENQLADLYQSRSWRFTRPLRKLSSRLARS